MRLSASNIAWTAERDEAMYDWLKANGFEAVEIAPTRIFPISPYRRLNDAAQYARELKQKYGLAISSMQSLWYGRTERLFGPAAERETLLRYTREAIDFARAVKCPNLVFGCPKNRRRDGAAPETVEGFLCDIAAYAQANQTVFALEPNPAVYGTDYLNHTSEALALAERLNLPGLRVNVDVGTMVENGESPEALAGQLQWVHHVHVSEPSLKPIVRRALHAELAALLREEGYAGYVSLETGRDTPESELRDVLCYVRETFG
ncbi:MAG: sugar phosphate isomerase/epimerase [Clostridia bacterium]|nr:sugar phosphate isomerase/epimerase [Clostridia bacterium]